MAIKNTYIPDKHREFWTPVRKWWIFQPLKRVYLAGTYEQLKHIHW